MLCREQMDLDSPAPLWAIALPLALALLTAAAVFVALSPVL